jgi:hypothetical protein
MCFHLIYQLCVLPPNLPVVCVSTQFTSCVCFHPIYQLCVFPPNLPVVCVFPPNLPVVCVSTQFTSCDFMRIVVTSFQLSLVMWNFWHNLQLVEGGQYLVEAEDRNTNCRYIRWKNTDCVSTQFTSCMCVSTQFTSCVCFHPIYQLCVFPPNLPDVCVFLSYIVTREVNIKDAISFMFKLMRIY